MRGATIFRPYLSFAAGLIALALSLLLIAVPDFPVLAQSADSGALSLGDTTASVPADGLYYANDDFKFTIAHKYGVALMRFAGDDEVFVLSVERASVGGRILKYDTGDMALQVTGYGAVTLYTSTAPGGLPVDRTGDGQVITFPVPSMTMLRAQAHRFSQALEQTTNLSAEFDADWSRIDDEASRYLTLDAMRITLRALRGLCANRVNESQLMAKVRSVRIARGDRPGIAFRGTTLVVTIAPTLGLRGRMSSLATARAIRGRI